VNKVRNFSIIAHIDHGKTTLTDRLLQLTKTLTPAMAKQERVMDSNPIEQERGITIKLAPVRMKYVSTSDGQEYLLHLIDTPGHVDFSYEVSRALTACEGVVLVVDATQGVQAQTLSHYYQAQKLNLAVIPVINKIDYPTADIEKTSLELMELCHVTEDKIIAVSAKTGENVPRLLEEIVQKIPPPSGDVGGAPRGLMITSYYHSHQGAIALVRVVDGEFRARQTVRLLGAKSEFVAPEVGYFSPEMVPTEVLKTGEVGYIATGLKDVRKLTVGDTLTTAKVNQDVQPLSGYQPPKPFVFLEIYPVDSADFPNLKEAIYKLVLRDAALTYTPTQSQALGSGFQMGFLGLLHAEVVLERLDREFDLSIIATTPTVEYRVFLKNGQTEIISSPVKLPDPSLIDYIEEPWVEISIYTPPQFFHDCMTLVQKHRGQYKMSQNVAEQTKIVCSLPLAELIVQFHDQLKSATSGFASFEYQIVGYQRAEIVRVDILINKELIEAFSFMCLAEEVEAKGRILTEKLKEHLPRQMFAIAIQACVGGKVIAREDLQAYRKDVTAKLYGGDVTRRKKLLAKQAKGKKRMKQFGKINVDQDLFLKILRQ